MSRAGGRRRVRRRCAPRACGDEPRRYVERLAEQDGWTIGEWETYDMTVFASESDVLTATR